MVQPSCPVTDRKMGGVGVGEQREELSRPAEQEWPWKEARRPEGSEEICLDVHTKPRT